MAAAHSNIWGSTTGNEQGADSPSKKIDSHQEKTFVLIMPHFCLPVVEKI